MERAQALVDHFRTLPVQLVDDHADGVLVAGDSRGGEDDAVTGLDLNLPMGGEGDAGEGRHGLALAAGGDDADLIAGQALDLIQVCQGAFGHLHVPQLGGHFQRIFHAAAADGHLPAIPCRHVHHLLDAIHVRGEGGDDDALVAAVEEGVKAVPHAALALGEAGALHVGGVTEHQQDALLAQLSQPRQVGHAAGDGGGVDLKVAGVDADPHGGVDGKGHGVGDGMVDVDELHGEGARFDLVPGGTGVDLGLFQQAVLLQLQLHQASGHAGGVDGRLDVPEDIGQRADVVFVAVGEENTPDFFPVLHQVADVRDDHVDAIHIVVREAHAAVHYDQVVAVLEHGHVFPDLVQTAQGDNLQFFCHISFFHSFASFRTLCSGRRHNGTRTPGLRQASPAPLAWAQTPSGVPSDGAHLPMRPPAASLLCSMGVCFVWTPPMSETLV